MIVFMSTRRPQLSTLFPYTTLFRSHPGRADDGGAAGDHARLAGSSPPGAGRAVEPRADAASPGDRGHCARLADGASRRPDDRRAAAAARGRVLDVRRDELSGRPDPVYWMFAGMNYLGGLICGLGYAAAFALLAMRLEGRTAHPGPAPVTDPAEPESSAVTSPVEPEPSTLAPAQLAYGVAARTDDPAPGRSPRSAASRAECGRPAVADLLSAAVGAAGAADGRLGPGYRRAHLHHRGGGDRLRGLAAVPADRVRDGRAGDAGSGREAAASDDVREA